MAGVDGIYRCKARLIEKHKLWAVWSADAVNGARVLPSNPTEHCERIAARS